MPTRTGLNLDVDLQRGVVPISKAASSLAALIKRARATGRPVIVTQKGYPTGVLLPIELFATLKNMADNHDLEITDGPDTTLDALSTYDATPDVEEAAPQEAAAPKPLRRKRAKAEPAEVVA
ncbi:type II toxin-antitoxin system Phd/YefM family antitoxin [Oscillochloris sp. ZM17-4]|uniref:type II toxin-antitoxin system Phd/YefM family antitoxin n=1 Tax=Oscillochloris sp. ZM17-4 TaxID=2866714 RepID=UPI001C737D93|nr:type II toxin-antitoxin system Phd/YefM family antitoxin [Oscillochloris sp. ZM17-4]MBX0327741.1 type II toxin-antitoxin system Phd/YefM family antitoxin [Oscillochloris sp. ZM17-4]